MKEKYARTIEYKISENSNVRKYSNNNVDNGDGNRQELKSNCVRASICVCVLYICREGGGGEWWSVVLLFHRQKWNGIVIYNMEIGECLTEVSKSIENGCLLFLAKPLYGLRCL